MCANFYSRFAICILVRVINFTEFYFHYPIISSRPVHPTISLVPGIFFKKKIDVFRLVVGCGRCLCMYVVLAILGICMRFKGPLSIRILFVWYLGGWLFFSLCFSCGFWFSFSTIGKVNVVKLFSVFLQVVKYISLGDIHVVFRGPFDMHLVLMVHREL